VNDVSRFYMKVAKERIAKGDNSEAALWTIYTVMLGSLKMLGCFSPMLSEHLYQRFFRKLEGAESLFLLDMEKEDEGAINTLYEKQIEAAAEVVSSALLARQEAGIKVRWPVRTLFIETKSHEVADAVNGFGDIILSMVNAKSLKSVDEKPAGELASSPFSKGTVHIDRKIDEALYEEGILNEVKRRVQMMRKEAGLVEQDGIAVTLGVEKELEAILKRQEKALSEAVNAKSLEYGAEKEMSEYTIDGRLVRIAIKKAKQNP